MKIIDEKGRFFGKINIIDFLAVLALVCILPAFYFGYKLMAKKTEFPPPKKEFIQIEINCQFIKLGHELLKVISAGDKELDENMQVVGEIITLGQGEPYMYKLDIGGEQEIVKADKILKQVKAKLKLTVEVRDINLYYKNQLIKVGSPFNFTANKYTLTAIPLEEEMAEAKNEPFDLFIILKDLDDETVKKISVGDKETDSSGEVIAEILSLGKAEDNSFKIYLGDGNFDTVANTGRKQVSAKMRLKCRAVDRADKGKELYFKGEKIAYNIPIEFKAKNYTAIGQVKSSSPLKEKWVALRVKFSEIQPEIANIIKKGDFKKDIYGNPIAKISSIIRNEPSRMMTLAPKEYEFITVNHPFYRDIEFSLEVKCTEEEGGVYFEGYPIKMGNSITFSTDLYSITGLIVGMEMK